MIMATTRRRLLCTVPVALLTLYVSGCSSLAAATPTPTAAAATNAASAPATNANARVSGTIQAVSGQTVNLADGKSFTLTDKTRIIRTEVIKAGDLKSGDYVAVTAKRQPDNTLLASIVNVFPASMNGVAVGQRPMTGGNLMTNATIDKTTSDGFTVTFPGGGAQIKLAPDAQINRLVDGTANDLKAGAVVSALVQAGMALSVMVR